MAPDATAPYVAIFSAFPAELAELVAASEIESTIDLGGRRWHLGRIEGVHVVLGLMGIGLVNADASARSVVEGLDVAAVIVSGVAGSPHRIGDVVVPARWMLDGERTSWRVNRALEALAGRSASRLAGGLDRCALVPPAGADPATVCMPHEPAVVLGGLGESGDPFGGAALPCTPGGGEVFGCEVPGDTGSVASSMKRSPPEPVVVDMETAAVARVARTHRVPFLGIRGVSDGAGDPLGDRGFPAQFFDYYRLAADNAARVTETVLGELAAVVSDAPGPRTCRLLARGRWRAATRAIRGRP